MVGGIRRRSSSWSILDFSARNMVFESDTVLLVDNLLWGRVKLQVFSLYAPDAGKTEEVIFKNLDDFEKHLFTIQLEMIA